MRVMIFNQKGGVGKTTTALNLAGALAAVGQRATMIDLDPQRHLTAACLMQGKSGDTAHDWLAGTAHVPCSVPAVSGLYLYPGVDKPLPAQATPPTYTRGWDIIDTPPAWSAATGQVAAKSDVIICPLEPDFLGLNGLNEMLRSMQQHGLSLGRLRVLLVRYSNRLTIHREVRARLIARFGTQIILPVVIRTSVRLAEASGRGETIFQYAPRSTGASDYAQLAHVLIMEHRLAQHIGA